MKKKTKFIAVLLALVMAAGLLSGCAAQTMEVSFMDDGTVQYSQARYISETYLTEDQQTTPQEYFKPQTESGRTPDWVEINGEKYWGIAPEVTHFESYDDLQKTIDKTEGVSLTIRTDGGRQYASFEFEIPSKAQAVREYGSGSAADEGLAELGVLRVELRFPGGIRSVDNVEERHYAVTGTGSQSIRADLFAADSPYTAVISGWLEGTSQSEIEHVDLTVGEIIGGVSTPQTVKVTADDGIGGLKTEEATAKWFMKNAAGTWDRMSDTDVFQTGESYSIDYFVFTRSGYTISQAVTGTCNGSPSITEYGPVRNSDNCIYISGAFGPLEGEVTEKTMIEKVIFTIDEPEAGKTAKDMTWSVTTVPEGALDMSRSTVIWYKCGSKNRNSNKWTEVKEGEAFAVGTFYSPDVFLYPANGYGFSPLTEGYINGMEPETYFGKFFRSDKEVYLAHMFDAVGGIPFTDVTGTDYFRSAVYWAYNSCPQITDGTSKTTFSPMRTCTRGQVVTFLWRSMGEPEPVTTTNPFTDVKTTDYYYKPVLWAVENGITDGTSPTAFSPNVTCRNNHILTFIWRAAGRPGDTGAEKTSEWYKDALDWARSSGFLNGTYSGDFNINGDCPRANVVEYLYRQNKM
ncbi:MAG: S-layer homology domain-containing protein [Firmicutes bacterium]|nr:S-layer homology domain-containing protein [Bacillota bacterium]